MGKKQFIMNISNQVTLIGNLGMDFEVKDFGNGRKLAKSSFATSESYKDKNGEYVQKTQWHNLIVWGKRAEYIADVTKKGSQLAIQGKLEYDSYEDKEGVTRRATKIIVSGFKRFDRKEQEAVPFN